VEGELLRMATGPAEAAEQNVDERRLCEGLRRGDEQALTRLVELYHRPLRHVALGIVRSPAVADEVVQETWLAVIRGVGAFEGRSSLKTWLYRIATNTALTRAERESRTIPISVLSAADEGPAVDPERFLDKLHERWPGHWASPPARWDEVPEEQLLGREALARISNAIDQLPLLQREVIVLRDVEGWSPEEVCERLEISAANQRVLLHRARSKVRQILELYFS
jgi:RNA polymerase sigma-70 factor, ECF subfamily